MLESKRFPREMRIERKMTALEKIRECNRLRGEINGIEKSMFDIRRDRDGLLRDANQGWRELRRLTEKSESREKLGIILNGAGLAISGGTTNTVKKIVGQAIDFLGTLIGFTTLERQIQQKLIEVRGLMERFEERSGQLDHLQKGVDQIHKTRRNLNCKI